MLDERQENLAKVVMTDLAMAKGPESMLVISPCLEIAKQMMIEVCNVLEKVGADVKMNSKDCKVDVGSHRVLFRSAKHFKPFNYAGMEFSGIYIEPSAVSDIRHTRECCDGFDYMRSRLRTQSKGVFPRLVIQ